MPLHVITANDTEAGHPAYLTGRGDWSRALAEARVFEDEAQRDQALALAKTDQARVADPYVIDVAWDSGGQLAATSLRERIRAEGPTVALVSNPSV
jgi:hypothetical protein